MDGVIVCLDLGVYLVAEVAAAALVSELSPADYIASVIAQELLGVLA